MAGLGKDTCLWVWGAVSSVELGHVDRTKVGITLNWFVKFCRKNIFIFFAKE